MTPSTSVWAVGFEPRFDLKCGRGSISPGEKCRKGAASRAGSEEGPSRTERVENFVKNRGRQLAIGSHLGAFVAGATGNTKLANRLNQVGTAAGVASTSANLAQGIRTKNAAQAAQAGGILALQGVLAERARRRNLNTRLMHLESSRRGLNEMREQFRSVGLNPRSLEGSYRELIKENVNKAQRYAIPSKARLRRRIRGLTRRTAK